MALDKNTYEIRFCELISASLGLTSPLGLRVVVSPCRAMSCHNAAYRRHSPSTAMAFHVPLGDAACAAAASFLHAEIQAIVPFASNLQRKSYIWKLMIKIPSLSEIK